LIGICAANILLYLFTFLFYRSLNKHRENIWTSMTPKVRTDHSLKPFSDVIPAKEQTEYLKTTNDVGNKRLDYRFVY
jgi:hypothetical protein